MAVPEEIQPFIAGLEAEIEKLESSISHVTKDGLAKYSANLPPLDRAKACMTLLYALNSSIFSALKVGEEFSSDHPVMSDIRRIQTYMKKVKNTEEIIAGRQLQVDKEAAGRFIKHALSGNDAYDEERENKRVASASRNVLSTEDNAAAVSKLLGEIRSVLGSKTNTNEPVQESAISTDQVESAAQVENSGKEEAKEEVKEDKEEKKEEEVMIPLTDPETAAKKAAKKNNKANKGKGKNDNAQQKNEQDASNAPTNPKKFTGGKFRKNKGTNAKVANAKVTKPKPKPKPKQKQKQKGNKKGQNKN
ncbi:hypothetical protein BZA70DRAFT_270739 [Myxozyma melibiosi]|uniref:Exosome complex protein n=1 Tax=Myxozyma melibiosi TaxID=54550 RepID=A0ABR1FBI1_9ASCO